jgi:hypothetical protein
MTNQFKRLRDSTDRTRTRQGSSGLLLVGLESALGNDGDLGGAIIRGSSNHEVIEGRPVCVNDWTLVHV